MAPGNSREINYDYFINAVDANKDKVISLAELTQEMKRMSPSGSVRRGDWVKRTIRTYDAQPTAAHVVFDFWDKDGDLTLSTYDLQSVLRESDFNEDGTVGTDEFVRFIERANKLSQRVTGAPLSTPLIQCPDTWWRDADVSKEVDITRAVMDFDDDLNGWISVEDLSRWLDTIDENDDSFISQNEYTTFQWQRYRINTTTAAAVFVLSDVNGDDKLDQNDWLNYFKGNLVVSFCDARQSLQYLITVALRAHQFTKNDELRESIKKRLKDETQQFSQNKPAPPTLRLRQFCSGQVACYVGEVTEEWWRPEAWLWWGVYLPEPASRPSLSQGRGMDNYAQRLPPPGGVLPVGIPTSVADIRGFTGSNWPQWPVQEFNSMPPMGSWSPFFPFKRSTNDPFRSKESHESLSKSPKVNLFNPFRNQGGPHSGSNTAPELDPSANSPHTNPSIQAGNRNSETEGQAARNSFFQPKNDDDFSKQSQNNNSESPLSENLDSEWADRKSQNKSRVDDFGLYPGSMPFPPFMFGVDPWMANSYPFWSMFGRLKRDEEQELKRHKRESEEKKDGVRLEEKDSGNNETNPWAYIRSWRPSFMMSPPMFSLPQWDPLLTWMAERDLWDAFLAHEWGDDHEKNSSRSNSSIQTDELWEKLSEIRENSKGNKDDQNIKESEERNGDKHGQQDLNKSRGKRFMGSDFAWQTRKPEWIQQSPLFPFYLPYYNAQHFRAQMPLLSRFWPQYSSQNWAVNRAFLPTNLWMNDYQDLNFNPRYYRNFRAKRKAGDGVNMKGNAIPGERRDSPFNQWKASMAENNRDMNSGKSDNIWRSEERKYQTFTDGNMKDWAKHSKFDDSRGGLLQKLLQSSTVKDDFSRNNKQAFADSKQRLLDSKLNYFSDSFSSSQLDSLLSSLIVKLLANKFWRNAVPQTTSYPFTAPNPWMQSTNNGPSESYPSRNPWQDLYLSERDWSERYFEEDQGRGSFVPGSMTGLDDSLYFLNSRIFRREQPDSRDPIDRANSLNANEDVRDQNETKANDSSGGSIRKKRFSMLPNQDLLQRVYSRCQEYTEQGKSWSYNVLDRICPYIWKANSNSDMIGWWGNVNPYLTNDDAFYYELIRNKRYNQNYWRNQQVFRDQAPRPASNWGTNNGDCREVNIQVNSEIPWRTWNMLRYSNLAEYAQGSRFDSANNPYETERYGRENQRATILLCSRKDAQNNVLTFIRRDNSGDIAVPGQEKLWNNMDWNLNPYRDDSRAGWSWRDKKEAPDSQVLETLKEVKRSTSDKGATTGRKKRWATNWFPWSTYPNHDFMYAGPTFNAYDQGLTRWPQNYPFYRNLIYSDVPNKMNPQIWNLWYSLITGTERYSRESGTGINAEKHDPKTSTWGDISHSNVKRSEKDGFNTGENVSQAEPLERLKRWTVFISDQATEAVENGAKI